VYWSIRLSSIDPYTPPKAPVDQAEKKPLLGLREYGIVAFVVLQMILSVRFAFTISKLISAEALDVVVIAFLLGTALYVGMMVLGGILTVRRGRSPTYLFVLAAVLSFLLMLQWDNGFSTASAIISLCTSVLSGWKSSRDDDDASAA
jgi:hypothetical protein